MFTHRKLSPLLLGALCFLAESCLLPAAAHAETEFGKYRMVLRSGGRVDGPKGEIRDGMLTATQANGESIEVPASEIRILETQSGSDAAMGFAVGALAGGLTLGLAILSVQSEENMEVDESKILPVGAVLILGGGVVGAVVGSRSAHWKEVHIEEAGSHSAKPMSFGFAWTFTF